MNKLKKLDVTYCSNCGRFGHSFKSCHDPITSVGIILFKLDKSLHKETKKFIEQYDIFNNNSINATNTKNNDKLRFIDEFKNKIKFLIVQRRHTLGYIEFLRGRYQIDDINEIIKLFEQMTQDEIDKIGTHEFDNLWKDLWKIDKSNNLDCTFYIDEYKQSKKKFIKLQDPNISIGLSFFVNNIKPKYLDPEWGFPKGRRNFNEKNIYCAKRELYEETNYKNKDYVILNRLYPLCEILTGTNGILYKHIYYSGISTTEKKAELDINNKIQMKEIGDIGWYSYNDLIKKIRPYHKKKINIIN